MIDIIWVNMIEVEDKILCKFSVYLRGIFVGDMVWIIYLWWGKLYDLIFFGCYFFKLVGKGIC